MDKNLETYLAWKSDLKTAGKTPHDMVTQFRSNGMTEYAEEVNAFILQMEALLSEPS